MYKLLTLTWINLYIDLGYCFIILLLFFWYCSILNVFPELYKPLINKFKQQEDYFYANKTLIVILRILWYVHSAYKISKTTENLEVQTFSENRYLCLRQTGCISNYLHFSFCSLCDFSLSDRNFLFSEKLIFWGKYNDQGPNTISLAYSLTTICLQCK